MGNQIGLEIGATGLRVGCAFTHISVNDPLISAKTVKRFYTSDGKEVSMQYFRSPTPKTNPFTNKVQQPTATAQEATEAKFIARSSSTWMDQHADASNETVAVSSPITVSSQPMQDGKTPNISNSEEAGDEQVLLAYLDSLACHYELLCEVLTMAPSSSLVLRRYYLWNLPTEAIDTAIELGVSFLKGKTLVLTGINTKEVGNRITQRWNGSVSVCYAKDIPCILTAIDCLLKNCSECIFSYERTHRALNEVLPDITDYHEKALDEEDRSSFYPFLLVNLKSGVSFTKVTAPGKSFRVGGSTIGGATFMGLCRLLMEEVSTPEEAMVAAQKGSNISCDMLVSDIYGGGYGAVGLPGFVIASTFGKLQTAPISDSGSDEDTDDADFTVESTIDSTPKPKNLRVSSRPSDEDVTRSLLTMMSYNVMQQAYLHSKIHCLPRIVLVGFLLNMPAFLASVQHSINFWSNGECKAHFIKLSPFLSAVGAILYNREHTLSSDFADKHVPAADKSIKPTLKSYLLDSERRIEIYEDFRGYVTSSGSSISLLYSPNLSFIAPVKAEGKKILTIDS